MWANILFQTLHGNITEIVNWYMQGGPIKSKPPCYH